MADPNSLVYIVAQIKPAEDKAEEVHIAGIEPIPSR